jgi:valyl-tRNA synthetase
VRPETKFGDTAVAVHPKDKRYKKWIGKEIEVEGLLGKFILKVIADDVVDMEFGTGVVKVTPAHDPNDFEMGKRHNLEMKKVIDLRGKLTAIAGPYAGMNVKAARTKIAEDLEKAGLLARPTDTHYVHSVTVCYKCGRDLEPTVMPNWFVKVDPLKPAVVKAVKDKKTQIFPKKFEKHLLDWMKIMHDWPISRQIAWGIRIPAWYDTTKEKLEVVFLDKEHKPVSGTIDMLLKEYTLSEIENGLQSMVSPKDAKYIVSDSKPGEYYLQETDTFDTWFSSGQWPLVTLKDDEYDTRYPTDVMATMSDILKFWVSRMMMFGIYVRGEVPFKNVYLWSTVTDGKGQKMSKSKGNVINPIDLVDKYGADAFRMSLLFGNGEGGKIPLSEDKVRAMRNFANKIWNMNRFYLMMAESKEIPEFTPKMKVLSKDDKTILKELNEVVKKASTLLDKFRFSEAADLIYHFLWHTVADEYIEQVKNREDKEIALSVLHHVLLTGLKLLHPFMPFVTESIWKEMPKSEEEMLISAKWPEVK